MFSAIANLFGYLLNLLYELVNSNFGIAIILFSILLRIILLPITIKQQKSVQKTSKIQGELKALQVKYKNNPEMLNKETMEIYKREQISPFSGCLSAIIQILIILSVFYLVSQPLTYMKKVNGNSELNSIVEEHKNEISKDGKKTSYIEIETISKIDNKYNEIVNQLNNNEIENKEELEQQKNKYEQLRINMDFFGLDLSKVPNKNLNDIKVLIIPILYVISSFISIKLTTREQNKQLVANSKEQGEQDPTAQMGKSMSYIMPIMTVSIACIAPLGLALYWLVSNVLMIGERLIINKFVGAKEVK